MADYIAIKQKIRIRNV